MNRCSSNMDTTQLSDNCILFFWQPYPSQRFKIYGDEKLDFNNTTVCSQIIEGIKSNSITNSS